MTREEALRVLSDHRDELKRLGVRSLALFGSVARNEAGPTSDVDLLVEFDGRTMGLFGFLEIKEYLEGILGCPVDLVTRAAVIEELKEDIYGEAVNVL